MAKHSKPVAKKTVAQIFSVGPTKAYPRDLIGYGNPHAQEEVRVRWPGDARIALQVVMNYEEGGENCILHGDKASEGFLSEIVNAPMLEGVRHISMESIYEYGSRAGVWRLLQLFRERQIPITVYGVATAMARHPAVIEQCLRDGHEIASHGYKWINYQYVPRALEKEHLEMAVELHEKITGEKPKGWYTGRTSPNTRALVAAHGGFLYDADDYSDDLPFWSQVVEKPHLVVPYTLDSNDMRFAAVQGFNTGDHFFHYLKDAFDCLYEEGATAPKMLSIGLHCRLIGRPGRIQGLKKFFDYAQGHDKVWWARRVDIANHWHRHHPYRG